MSAQPERPLVDAVWAPNSLGGRLLTDRLLPQQGVKRSLTARGATRWSVPTLHQ